ncbi:MAG: histidine phosphatase family protein [Clostridia bacterium]|nr:histidine phosphatase family protein [Clostridia bacterium]
MPEKTGEKTIILLIRHGESEANVQKIFAGNTDAELTEKGLNQAKITAEYLKERNISAVYSSDLSRAFRTACETAALHGLKVIKDKRLREIYGGKWEGLKEEERRRLYPDAFRMWAKDMELHIPGGESPKEVQARMLECILEIAKSHVGQTVCAASHAGAIRALCAVFFEQDGVEFADMPWVTNASVTTLIYMNGVLSLEEYGYDKHQMTDGV